MVLRVAGHWGVVNSKALELGGIDESSEPPEGGRFGRDASGRLNGILFEQAIFDYAYPQATRRPHTVAPPSAPAVRIRSFIDYGIPVVGSSDYPCGPFQPLLALQSCITRTGADGTPVGRSQRIARAEALALYTVSAALASDEDRFKGCLAPGYRCDFIVLDDNPLAVDPLTLGGLGIRATYVGGTKVWARAA